MDHLTPDIIHHLCRLLLQLYSHHGCHKALLSKEDFRLFFIPCIATYFKISPWHLPGQRTFFRAFRKGICSSATFEKLAMFYYFMVDVVNREKIKADYLIIANRQRLQLTPYYNRFEEEFQSLIKKDKVSELPKDFVELIDRLSDEDIEKLKKEIEKREKKEKKGK